MQYVNCTPHSVTVIDWKTGAETTYPPSGRVARLGESCSKVDDDGHPIIKQTDPYGLPRPKANTMFIVSRLAATGAMERDDLVFPYDEVRDEEGRILGVHFLAKFAR